MIKIKQQQPYKTLQTDQNIRCFAINAITAFDLLSFADDVGIKFDFLKRRIERLALACQNHAARLRFTEDHLTAQQDQHIKALVELVKQRSQALLEQSRQFRAVIRSAF